MRGSEPCQVAVERGVQLAGLDTEYETARDTRNAVYTRDIATIDSLLNPKKGDTLTIGADDFVLDVKVDDSGAYARFIVVKV